MMPSNPYQKAYSCAPLSGPGIIYTTSRLIPSSGLSQEKFNWWYDNVHIRDMLATGAVSAAFRFKNIKADAETPFLAIYVLEDMKVLEDPEFYKNVPLSDPYLPGGASVKQFVDFDTRYYLLIQRFEIGSHPKEWYPALISAGLEPAEGGAEDLDKWYREEHCQQATTQPGWKRTTRYKLVFQTENNLKKREDTPTWLALHEWEKGYLGDEVQPFDPVSEWTRRIMRSAKGIEAGNWEKIGSWGSRNGE